MSRYLDLAANCLALGERHPRRALALALAAAELLDRATRLGRPISPAEQERLADLRAWSQAVIVAGSRRAAA